MVGSRLTPVFAEGAAWFSKGLLWRTPPGRSLVEKLSKRACCSAARSTPSREPLSNDEKRMAMTSEEAERPPRSLSSESSSSSPLPSTSSSSSINWLSIN